MVAMAMSPQARPTGPLVDHVRNAILEGRFPPGSRLVQQELAALFGTSRIPLREALNRLEGEGLVVMSPNRGATVRPLSALDVADLFDLRLTLETMAVRGAAGQRADLRATVAVAAAAAAEAVQAGRPAALFHLDRDFHAGIAEQTGNRYLVEALGSQWSQIMRLMHAHLSIASYPAGVWREHAAIASAIAGGDGDGAVALITSHLVESRDLVLAHWSDARPTTS